MHALKLSLIARFPSFIQSGNMFVHFLPREIRSRGGLYIAQNGKTRTDDATEIASRRGVFSLPPRSQARPTRNRADSPSIYESGNC